METKAFIITFRNSTDAMTMQSKAERCNIPGRLIPTPRSLTTSCGLSWGASEQFGALLSGFLSTEKISYEKTAVMAYSGVL